MNLNTVRLGLAWIGCLALAPRALAGPVMVSPALLAQNTYESGSAASQDNIWQSGPNANYLNGPSAAHQEVMRAETNLNFSAGFLHQQYHENLPQGTGDDESGQMAGFGVGMSGLLPLAPGYPDIYSSLSYDFNAGNITYGGHYLFSGLPAQATDNTVMNRIEARIGLGFPLRDGIEVIPFFAAGYQAWNRNINQKDEIGSDEFYRSGLVGLGVKLDAPVTPALVLSVSAEGLALVGGSLAVDNLGTNNSFGVSGEERVELGADYDLNASPFHVFARGFWEHFNYTGFKPVSETYFYYYEPLSTTTQFGANVGMTYSFN